MKTLQCKNKRNKLKLKSQTYHYLQFPCSFYDHTIIMNTEKGKKCGKELEMAHRADPLTAPCSQLLFTGGHSDGVLSSNMEER